VLVSIRVLETDHKQHYIVLIQRQVVCIKNNLKTQFTRTLKSHQSKKNHPSVHKYN